MQENKLQQLSTWIEELSPQSQNDLRATISAIIPVSEVVGSNPIGFSALPFSQFDFEENGIPELRAERLLNAISFIVGNEEIDVIEDKIYVSLEGIKMLKNAEQILSQNIQNVKQPSTFNAEHATLKIGETTIQLPPHKNEHFLCNIAYRYSVNEPVDWQEIYEKITGLYQSVFGKPKETKENWRQVYDTVTAINRRVKEKRLPPLFAWQELTVKRLY